MNSYSKIAKWTTIIEKLSRLTVARGATADEAALALLKIELLQRRIAQLQYTGPDVPRRPITATQFVWKTPGADSKIRASEHVSASTAAKHLDWFILLKRIQRLNTSRTHH
jgi:hypothetical protein